MPGGMYRQTGQHGDLDQSQAVWKAAVAVAPGDFIFRHTDGYDYPLSSYTWNTNIATTLAEMRPKFRGVAMAKRLTTQTTDGGISDGGILETGEFCYPCAALGAAAAPGEFVTVAKQSGDLLENQKVVISTTEAAYIGIVTRDAPIGATFLYFKLLDQPLIKGVAA